MTKTEKWQEKVEKLLNRANDPSVSEGERANLMDKVAELMAKFGIEEAMLRSQTHDNVTVITLQTSVKGTYSNQRGILLFGLSTALWVSAFAETVVKRVKASVRRAERDVQGTGNGMEIALRDKAKSVNDAFRVAYPNSTTVSSSSVRSNVAGYHAGVNAGNNADIGQTRVGGSRPALGSGK